MAALNWLLSETFDLSYPILIPNPDPNDPNCKVVVARISDALCHARFYGDNPASDEVPLMKILQVRGGRGEGNRRERGGGRKEGERGGEGRERGGGRKEGERRRERGSGEGRRSRKRRDGRGREGRFSEAFYPS